MNRPLNFILILLLFCSITFSENGKPTIDTIKINDLYYYRTFEIGEVNITVKWFELLGEREADKKINIALNGQYPSDQINDNYFNQFDNDVEEDHMVQIPERWLGQFLVVREAHSWFYKGLNHNQYDSHFRTFDLSTGEKIDMKSWQSWIDNKYLSEWGVGKKLGKLIFSKRSKDDYNSNYNNCIDLYNENTQLKVRLDTVGIIFFTEFPTGNCDQEFNISFKELWPFLSKKGKEMMNLFLKK